MAQFEKTKSQTFFSIHFLQAASDFIRLVRPRPIDCDSGSEHTMKDEGFPLSGDEFDDLGAENMQQLFCPIRRYLRTIYTPQNKPI